MAIKDWHTGKIGLLWGIDLVLLLGMYSGQPRAGGRGQAVLAWLIISIPVFVVTWKSLTAREGQNKD
jgi:hypothetical protein